MNPSKKKSLISDLFNIRNGASEYEGSLLDPNLFLTTLKL